MKRQKKPIRLATSFEVHTSKDSVAWQHSGGSKSITQATAIALGWRKLGCFTRTVKVTRHVIAHDRPLNTQGKQKVHYEFDKHGVAN